MEENKYEYKRVCKCGNIDSIYVSKRDAAFEIRSKEIWNQKCSKCGEEKCASLVLSRPEIDKDLLIEWANDSKLYFMQQDEDLILAEENNLRLILDIIDNHKILIEKRNILISSLCVLVYDNGDDTNTGVEVSLIISELEKRKHLVVEADEWIMDYIKEIVYPKIGLEIS